MVNSVKYFIVPDFPGYVALPNEDLLLSFCENNLQQLKAISFL